MIPRLGPLLLLPLVFVVLACGDEGAGSSTNATTRSTDAAPTREEFIARGDALCKRAYARVDELERRAERLQSDPASYASKLKRVAPMLVESNDLQREWVSKLRELTPPAGDEATVDRILTSVEEQTELLERMAEIAEDGDAERYQQLLTEASEGRQEGQALLQGYGFEECGGGE